MNNKYFRNASKKYCRDNTVQYCQKCSALGSPLVVEDLLRHIQHFLLKIHHFLSNFLYPILQIINSLYYHYIPKI